ncbi:MAG TPA: hypothetical protein PLN19_01555 [Methanothrix sp.]|jgi:hypothetical protein|nr:hypothetical protein [Methanothrix sp.]HQE86937.1 hypothetical protein [Methanothrix sp.]
MTEAIILDMDETRELKWTFGAIKTFEKRAREILKRLDVRDEKGRAVANIPMHAGFVLANFLRISDIMEAAIGASTGLSALDGKDTPSEAAHAIDAYLERGGSLEELQRQIYRAYLVASDPSSLSDWEENLAREEEIRRINREKQEAKVEIARIELAEDQKKIASLKTPSGSQPTRSPTSS